MPGFTAAITAVVVGHAVHPDGTTSDGTPETHGGAPATTDTPEESQ